MLLVFALIQCNIT